MALSFATTFIVSSCEWEAPRKESLHGDIVQSLSRPLRHACDLYLAAYHGDENVLKAVTGYLDRDQSILSAHGWDVTATL